ncbi:hypothetical protein [Aureliella helgolandensis]|uniref:Selenocysteine synthase n=1 Tax=Aureliella helgolandensis TaxID=2527968 RepID=A0A518G8H8_9BACT|nr:hypothetical protein [Aureliella helgolandensis]QDV24889.1 selenocysteine synthase [Aureliella helgolandensis]
MIKIPRRLDDILPAAAMERVLDVLQQPELTASVRETLSKMGVKELNPIEKMQDAWRQTRVWLESMTGIQGSRRAATAVLNATGQLFHPQLAGSSMASAVAYGYANAALSFQFLEELQMRAQQVGRTTLGCAHTAWVSDVGNALRLVAKQFGATSLVVARSDLLRIAVLGDVSSLLELANLPITEIGATNQTTVDDWQQTLVQPSQLVVLVSPNSLPPSEAAAQRTAAIEAAQASGAQVLEILLDGVVSPAVAETLHCPLASQRLASGVDGIILPLNFLLGGPRGVLVAGEDARLGKLQRLADMGGVALSGPGLAAAVITLQFEQQGNESEAGVASALQLNPENLKDRASRLVIQLNDYGPIAMAEAVERRIPIGPAPWNRYELSNWAVKLTPRSTVASITDPLRQHREGRAILADYDATHAYFDLRFIMPSADHELVEAVSALVPNADGASHSTMESGG